MNLQSATVDQIATFKAAAAQRYAQRGVDPKVANQLFERKMAEISNTLAGQPVHTGITRAQASEKIASVINAIRRR